MTNEELNTRLYQKMFAEQEKYRDWLLTQPPKEILEHGYEFIMREDILLSLEYHDLPDAQAKALLKSPSPLADVFKDWEKKETDHIFCPIPPSASRKGWSGTANTCCRWRVCISPRKTLQKPNSH